MTACEVTTRMGGAGRMGLGPEGRTASKLRKKTILVDADGPGCSDRQVAEAFRCRVNTVENVRRRCVLDGFELAVCVRQRSDPPVPKLLDGKSPMLGLGLVAGRNGVPCGLGEYQR